jgi:DNA-binding Lrp family transcriptional regulator
MALTPNLTPLDRRVLEAVQVQPRHGTVAVAARLNRGKGPWEKTPEQTVHEILRGLEHLGLVKRKAGGWWVAT